MGSPRPISPLGMERWRRTRRRKRRRTKTQTRLRKKRKRRRRRRTRSERQRSQLRKRRRRRRRKRPKLAGPSIAKIRLGWFFDEAAAIYRVYHRNIKLEIPLAVSAVMIMSLHVITP